jgi:general secretion pathway protein C
MLTMFSGADGGESPPLVALGSLVALGLVVFATLWLLQDRFSPPDLGETVVLKNDAPAARLSSTIMLPSRPIEASPSVTPAAPLDGLVLRGVFFAGPGDSSVILGSADGRDRVITIGREFRPGARLKEVGPSFAVIATQAGDLRLELGRSGSTASVSSPASDPKISGEGRSAGPVSPYHDTVAYRTGLQPVISDGRIQGFAIKPNAVLPQLQQAGLQQGDILVAVNERAFDSEEKVLELSNEIATSRTAGFEFIRNGKKMTASLVVKR